MSTLLGLGMSTDRRLPSVRPSLLASSLYRVFLVSIICAVLLHTVTETYAEQVEAMIDETVDLRCEINEKKCGQVYFVTWSRNHSSSSDWERVYIHSKDVKKVMKSLSNPDRAVMFLNSTSAVLRISPVKISDDGVFKCDVVYVEELCPSFSFTKLLTLVVPGPPIVSLNNERVQDRSVVGPLIEGTEQNFRCESFGGKPSPVVTWMREETTAVAKPSWDVGEHGLVNASNTLKVLISRGDLGAKLTCKVDHNYTSTNYLFSLQIDISVAPLWIELEGVDEDSLMTEGDSVELRCKVLGAKPAAKITWYNGTEVLKDQPPSDVSVLESDRTFVTQSRLIFASTRFEHQKTITCKGNNEVLEEKNKEPLEKSVKLSIKYTPTIVLTPEKGFQVNETDPALLFCTFEANPDKSLEVEWYLNGKPLEQNDNFERGDKLSPPYLKVTQVLRAHQGFYSCGIRNEIGWANSTNQVYIDVFHAPDVTARISPTLVSEDRETTVSLSCVVTAANPDEIVYIRWYKNGVVINETTATEIVWVDVQRSSAGLYSCRAQNAAGWGPKSDDQELIVIYAPGEARASASSTNPIKGSSLELNCVVSDLGNPEMKVFKWYKDGEFIAESRHGNITIDFVTLSTEGNYSCLGVNQAGQGQPGHHFVNVYAPPAFIENLPPMSGAKKTAESVSMTCTVECDPPCTVQWLKNGENLQDSDMYVIKTSAQTQNEQRNYFESVVTTLYWNLTAWPNGILQESLVDGANFSCVSSDNAVGPGVSSTTLFRVEYAPEFAEIFPAAVNITEGIVPNDMLRCEASAFPEPNFLWKFGEQVVSSEQTLIMNYNVTRDKHGVYTCIVTNRHGTTQANANVHVLYAPECSISLSEADEDGKVNLTCAADADPSTIDFTWSRDNSTLKVDLHSQLDDPLSFSIIKVRRGDPEYYGQYSCVANNTVGDSNPCSFKITGAAPLLVEEESNILLIIIIVIVLIILIIIIIIIICCCCLRKKKNKDPDDIGQREGPVGKSEPTPPRPADRKPGPGEPVYQNVNKSNAPKLQAMPRNRNKPLYENVPPPNVTPRDGPFRPDDDDLVYADLYDDIKMGKVPDPRKERPPLPPKKSKQKLDENSAADRPSVSRPAPISNGSTAL